MTFLQQPLFKTAIRYALLASLLVVVTWIMLLFFVDAGPREMTFIKTIADAFLLGIFIFFANREFKKYYQDGKLHFWQGMTAGFINYFTVAIISAGFIYVFITFFQPDYLTQYVSARIDMIESQKALLIEKMGEDAYINAMEGINSTTNFTIALDDFLKKTIFGLFLTIILSFIQRK